MASTLEQLGGLVDVIRESFDRSLSSSLMNEAAPLDEIEGIPVAPSDPNTKKPGVIFVLEKASLEVAKVGKNHANFLKRNNKDPAQYMPDIVYQIKKELHVYLADIKTNAPDFRVSGSYTSLYFKVFQGRRLIAEVKHKFTLESFWKGKEIYIVKVYPEVDYAFIIALLVTLDENDTP